MEIRKAGLVLMAAVLAVSSRAMAADDGRTLTAADDGKTITIQSTDKKLHISLEGNATTGFTWTVTKLDGKSLVQNGDIVYQGKGAPGMVGGGGGFVATFDVQEAGKTVITMEYKRPWETTTPAAKTFTVTVNVVHEAVTQPAK